MALGVTARVDWTEREETLPDPGLRDATGPGETSGPHLSR